MTFLIAEDDELWQELTGSLLGHAGYAHKLATSWSKVVNLLRQSRFDGMIVDLSLGLSTEAGLEALAYVARLSPPKTMVLSTYSHPTLLEKCYTMPFITHVVPKSRVIEHADDFADFIDGGVSPDDIASLISSRRSGIPFRLPRATRKSLAPEAPVLPNDPESVEPSADRTTRTTVFVVHGRNAHVRADMFAFLRALGLRPLEWSEAVRMAGTGTPYIGAILDQAFETAAAVVVLLTGDDEGRLDERFRKADDPIHERELTKQARGNVIFEAGLAFGRKPERTILVEFGLLRPFSDFGGRHVVRFTGSPGDRNELATRLQTAGCEVRKEGTDWLSVGAFDRLSF
jgi:predicted nucleotide-binding protein